MGANCREDNSLLFGKTNYINSFSILLKTKNYVSVFLVFVNFQKCWAGCHLERNYVGRSVKYNS